MKWVHLYWWLEPVHPIGIGVKCWRKNFSPLYVFTKLRILYFKYSEPPSRIKLITMSFTIHSRNPSNDDNLFFMGLRISAEISKVNDTPAGTPPPGVPDSGATVLMLGLAVGSLTVLRRRVSRS